MCHHDLKPDNCFVDVEEKTLKVIDYGMSKGLQSARTLQIGIPDFMAPELLNSPTSGDQELQYDPEKVVVFAMGVTLYVMLTGIYPFEERNNKDFGILKAIKNLRKCNFRRPPPEEIIQSP